MLNSEFKHWLYGYFKLSSEISLTPKQLWVIKNHLNLVQAVEGFLDDENRWLDAEIVSLAKGNIISEPPEILVKEIYEKYTKQY